MKLLCYAAALCLAAVPAVAAPAPAPKATTNKAKIVGVWELVKAEDGAPPGTTVEFTKDGRVKIPQIVGGANVIVSGIYSVEGDRLKVTIRRPGGKKESETDTITKLTDTELRLKDARGQTADFKRKKK